MKRFRFGLETLLRIRRRLEERARQEFLDQQTRVVKQQEKITALTQARQRSEAETRRVSHGTIDLAQTRSAVEFRQALEKKLATAREQLARLEGELVQRRAALVQARRAVKMLEKLRERRLAEYRQAYGRREQQRLDETAHQRFAAEGGAS